MMKHDKVANDAPDWNNPNWFEMSYSTTCREDAGKHPRGQLCLAVETFLMTYPDWFYVETLGADQVITVTAEVIFGFRYDINRPDHDTEFPEERQHRERYALTEAMADGEEEPYDDDEEELEDKYEDEEETEEDDDEEEDDEEEED